MEKNVQVFVEAFPEAKFCLVREITKMYESRYEFNSETWDDVRETVTWRGEFVFLMQVKNSVGVIDYPKLIKLSEEVFESGGRPKDVSKLLSFILGKPSKEIYKSFLD